VINNLKIFKALVLLIFGINNIFCQSAEEILIKAQEKSLILTDSYYKFKIESKLDNPILPISGELFTRGEKYFIDTKYIDQIYDGENIFTIVHENQEIIIGNSDIPLFNFTPYQLLIFFKEDHKLDFISNSKKYIIRATNLDDGIIYLISINSSNYSIEKIEMKDSSSNQVINTFLTLTYDYNLSVPLSLFKFDINKYKNYTIIK
tara:strand:+ start:929 stop:1543 length:615 start_codon:yes stop_codon:yes gene_type:complete